MARDLDQLADEDRKALRGSKFAPLPSLSTTSRPQQPRLAHPGGPLRTNKAAALAKFLERKLQDPNGFASINPDLIELAVKNAKETVNASSSGSGKVIQHVASFDDPEVDYADPKPKRLKKLKMNQKKQKKKKKKRSYQGVPPRLDGNGGVLKLRAAGIDASLKSILWMGRRVLYDV